MRYSMLMFFVVLIWLAAAGLELLTPLPGFWRLHKLLSYLNIFTGAFAASLLVVWMPNLFTVVLAALSGYRLFNQVRIVEARMHERYLQRATGRTSLMLISYQVLIGLGWAAWHTWHTDGQTTWAVFTGLELAVALLSLAATLRRLKRTAWPAKVKGLTDSQLPTVSVAVPARNETEELEQCLQSLVANNYPKLEVLVLDDCSQTKQTPEIIRSFAHDGVRFVQGDEPRETWLPKTQAYARLVEEASGEYLLFCGVDIRFEPDAIRQIVNMMHAKHKDMICILPLRASRSAALVQAMRYFWELVPPRRLFRRPPVLSSCWVIRRDALKKAGGFEAVTRSIVPEAYFARQLLKTDGYSFMRAGKSPGVTSIKSQGEQRDTAIRMRYPQLHRRPENVVYLTFGSLAFLTLPYLLAVGGFWLPIGGTAHLLAALAAAVLTITYELMGLSTRVTTWWFGLVALPIVAIYDLLMLHMSMWQYEFSVVEWKGRNICIPAMHVIPHLPKLE